MKKRDRFLLILEAFVSGIAFTAFTVGLLIFMLAW
jgi:hypothetical protein